MLERCTSVRIDGSSDTVPLTDALRKQLMDRIIEYGTGEHTLRCLGLATLDSPAPQDEILDKLHKGANFVDFEQDMTFVGCVGMLDPPRLEVKPSIEACRAAGIRVIVITGDNKVLTCCCS